jgi:hypothetical protein
MLSRCSQPATPAAGGAVARLRVHAISRGEKVSAFAQARPFQEIPGPLNRALRQPRCCAHTLDEFALTSSRPGDNKYTLRSPPVSINWADHDFQSLFPFPSCEARNEKTLEIPCLLDCRTGRTHSLRARPGPDGAAVDESPDAQHRLGVQRRPPLLDHRQRRPLGGHYAHPSGRCPRPRQHSECLLPQYAGRLGRYIPPAAGRAAHSEGIANTEDTLRHRPDS